MISVKENTTLIGVSELRMKTDRLLEKMHKSRIVIEKRHKPIAILMSNEEYESTGKLFDLAEDIILGYLAKERFKNSAAKDYIDIEEALKKAEGHRRVAD